MELMHRCCNLQKTVKTVSRDKFLKILKELKLPKMTYEGLPTKSSPTLASPALPTLKTTVHAAICRTAVGAMNAWSHAVQASNTDRAKRRGLCACSPSTICSLVKMVCLYGDRISLKGARKSA